jgi:hypothetical protein
MIAKLRNERGTTLLEAMATALIVAAAMISLYTGIIYADKQVQRNYHDRVATLHASGELEWQMYYKKNYKTFDLFTNRPVVIDNLARGKTLSGLMSAKLTETSETPFGASISFSIVEVSVVWIEPGDKTARKIVVRDDFY